MLKAQRWYYIFAILISLTLPLLSSLISPVQDVFESMMLPNFTITYTPSPDTIERELVAMEATEPITSAMWTLGWWKNTLLIIWVSGLFILGLRLAIGWITLRRLLKGAEKRKQGEATLYLVDKKIAPFTYRKSIVINRTMAHDSIMNSILCHELEHVRQKHYRDLTLGVLLQLLQWWNPFAWSLLHNQRNTLEYLADEGVLSSGLDKKRYQLHLLQGVTGLSLELPLLSFSVQNLKKRILTMNTQKKEKKWAGIMCALTSIPVAAVLLFSTQLVNAKPAPDILLDGEKNNTEMISKDINTIAPVSELQKPTRQDPPKKDGEVFEYTDEMPEFPGGMTELMSWLSENIKYPAEAVKQKIEGRVFVSFIIEKDGSVSNLTIAKGAHELLDQEALRIVGLMPKWEPGKDKGKLVRCRYTLPISFKLPPEQHNSKDNGKE